MCHGKKTTMQISSEDYQMFLVQFKVLTEDFTEQENHPIKENLVKNVIFGSMKKMKKLLEESTSKSLFIVENLSQYIKNGLKKYC